MNSILLDLDLSFETFSTIIITLVKKLSFLFFIFSFNFYYLNKELK